jgi:hypothetical protein
MKRFLGILICVFAFAGCDDGDLVIETVDFSEISTSSCSENNLLFKLKEGEALILNVPEETFAESPTPVDTPIKLAINNENQVVYNFYNGKVAAGNICDLIPPATPTINKQWNASSGVIEITTTAVKKLDETNNSTRITGYNSYITFRNITFKKDDGTTQFYETLPFGDYLKSVDPLPFKFQDLLERCSDSGQLYKYHESEAFTLDIDPALIQNIPTEPNSPRIGTIDGEKNKLVYRLYNSIIPSEYFCQPKDPALPTVNQTWLGKPGGTIEVTTTTSGPAFKHVIILKNVTLEKGNSNFRLGDSYKFGEYTK